MAVLLVISIIVILAVVFVITKTVITRNKTAEVKKNILERQLPLSVKEAELYEEVIINEKANEILAGLGLFLLLRYYKDNINLHDNYINKAIEFGERIRNDYIAFAFYEDSMFMLGNIFFFELYEFSKAQSIYRELISNKLNTKWKDICAERIDLIDGNADDIDALKLYITAEKYFESGDFIKAENHLKDVLEHYPVKSIAASALFFMGDIKYYKFNDLDSAIKYYRTTVDKFPLHSNAQKSLYKIGEIFRKQASWEDALNIYKEYSEKYKDSAFIDDAFFYKGECYKNMGDIRSAKNVFSLLLGDYPDSKWTEVIYSKIQEINKKLSKEFKS